MIGTVDKGYATAALVVGIISGVCGVASAIAGVVWISYRGPLAFGLWSGSGLIIIGLLGVIIYVKKSMAANVFFLILNILYIIICIVQVAMSGIAAAAFKLFIISYEACLGSSACYCGDSNNKVNDCDDLYPMHDSLVAITAFCAIAAISTFSGSIIGCCIACCNKTANVQPVIVQQPAQAFVITSQQQYPASGQSYPVPGQPYPAPGQPQPYPEKNSGPPVPPPAYS